MVFVPVLFQTSTATPPQPIWSRGSARMGQAFPPRQLHC